MRRVAARGRRAGQGPGSHRAGRSSISSSAPRCRCVASLSADSTRRHAATANRAPPAPRVAVRGPGACQWKPPLAAATHSLQLSLHVVAMKAAFRSHSPDAAQSAAGCGAS